MLTTDTAAELAETIRALFRTGKALQQHHNHHGDLPPSAVALLGLLDQVGELRLGKLAEHLAVDPSVISRQITPVVEAGLVCRRPDPLDGRAHLLTVTPAGRDHFERSRAHWAELLVGALRDWTEPDARSLITALNDVLDALRHAQQRTAFHA